MLKNVIRKRMCIHPFAVWVLLALFVPALAAAPKAGKNVLSIRGRQVEIDFYPAAKDAGAMQGKIFYTPGNAGMKRMAVDMAQMMASWGYDVYGLDVKDYLEKFTSDHSKLQAAEAMADYREIAKWMTAGKDEPVTLVGWSQGAGMALLAATPEENKKIFNGVISIGLAEKNLLGWKWSDDFADALKKVPNEPTFRSTDYLPRISPLPFYQIQSSQDEWVAAEAAKKMFALAPEPKKFILIQAENHHFKNNVEAFYTALREGLEWIKQSH